MGSTKYIPALGYDFLSGYYDLAIKWTMPEREFRSRLVDYLNPKVDESILEFGYGTGQNLRQILEREPNIQLQGVDIDPGIEEIARKKLEKQNLTVPLHLYDGITLPFGNNAFDKVFSSLVFHQLDAGAKQNCLKELYRVLKPRGSLIIGDWGKAKSKWMRFAFYSVQILDGFASTTDNVKGLLPQYISAAGFQNAVEKDYINTRIGTFSFYTANK